MSEIKIKCPKCGKVLRLADHPNINNAVFTCPVCKVKSKVGNCQRIVDTPMHRIASEETQYSFNHAPSRNTEETRYVQKSAPAAGGDETIVAGKAPVVKVGCLMDGFGRSYQLSVGINTIGRKATTSPATVQIAVDDRYMSRSHAIIEVRNTGGQVIHILRNGKNQNPSYLNGTLIQANDQLILNNGDNIKFGNTELIFKK